MALIPAPTPTDATAAPSTKPSTAAKDPLSQLKEYVTTKPTGADFITEVKQIVKANKLSKQKFGAILFDVFFDSSNILRKDTMKNACPYLADFLNDEESIQKAFLNKILSLCDEKKELISKASAILNSFFVNKLFTDEVIINWNEQLPDDKETNVAFKANISTMITWLKTPEDEEEEGDE